MKMNAKIIKRILLQTFAFLFRNSSRKVVFYHDIGRNYTPMGTSSDLFWAHMQYLRKGDVVCFDDGFRGIWDERERLKNVSKEFSVIVFVAVGLVGRQGYLNWDEIRELQDNYGIEFQCHTWSHQTLVGPWNAEEPIPSDGRMENWFMHEIVESKDMLEKKLGKSVTALCFPVGYFCDEIIQRCIKAGYEKVFASYPGNITDEYVQPRCLVQDMSVGEFRSVLNGGMNLMAGRYLKRHKIEKHNPNGWITQGSCL